MQGELLKTMGFDSRESVFIKESEVIMYIWLQPMKCTSLLSFLKRINLVLIFVMPLMLIMDIVVLKIIPILLTVFVYIFAIMEYVNYFHTQLTNYKNGKGKKSSIVKEIEKAQKIRVLIFQQSGTVCIINNCFYIV